MLNNREIFTIDLRDLYGSKLDKLAAKSDKQFARINKGIGGVSTQGKKAAKSIDEIDKRIDSLKKRVNLSVDISSIKTANREIQALQRERDKLSGLGTRGRGGMLGSLGKGLLIGAVASIGIGTLGDVIDKAVGATAKYEKFEAVLSNTLGSRGAAKNQMQMISDFASKTPFQVDELTEGFVKLANQGFTPTLRQMTSLGDLAASTGKTYDQLVEAILDAQTGEFERLKEFGIRASAQGDKVAFTFKGQTTVVDKSAEAMRNYVLSLGNAVGVSGAMEKISLTTGGQISNLHDNVDLLWKALGERFNPEIKSSIGFLNKTVSTIRSWVEIPTSKKLEEETNHLQQLRIELGLSNTTEERRKEILEEVKQIQPDIVDGTKSEKEQLLQLNSALDSYIDKRRKQIALQGVKETFGEDVANFQTGENLITSATGEQTRALALAKTYFGFSGTGSLMDQVDQLRQFLGDRRRSGKKQTDYVKKTGANVYTPGLTDEGALEYILNSAQSNIIRGAEIQKKAKPGVDQFKKASKAIDDLLGQTATGNNAGTTTTTTTPKSLDTAGINSVNSGSSVKNIYLTINNLMNGDVIIQSTTIKDGVSKAKDLIIEGLLTAVNDANLAGGNQ